MREVYELSGANGTSLFSTKAAAEGAAARVPKGWGRAVGGRRLAIRTIRVYRTADEWTAATGMGGQR